MKIPFGTLPFLVRLWLFVIATLTFNIGLELVFNETPSAATASYASESTGRYITGERANMPPVVMPEDEALRMRGQVSALVSQFHDRYNRLLFDSIYEDASIDSRRYVSRERYINSLQSIRQNLGAVEYWKTPSEPFFDYDGDGRWRVIFDCEAKFTEGTFNQHFVWYIQDGEATLHYYSVGKDAMPTGARINSVIESPKTKY